MSYWSGAARRVLPALLVGVVAAAVCLVLSDGRTALLVGAAATLAATLLPPRRVGR